MKQTTHIIFAIVLSAALLLPNLGLGVTGNAADSRTHQFVMVAPEDETKLSGLGIRPFNVIDYGSFLWLELNQDDFARLEGVIPYREAPKAGVVNVPSARFDRSQTVSRT